MGQWNLDASVGIVCEVAFTTGPLDTPVWTDVSTYLDKDWMSFRGKESEDDDIQPGQFTVYLDNSLRTFDPENAAGPYFGNLKPMKKIRLRVAVGAFSATIITGFVLGWPQQWGTFKSVAAVECVDGSRLDSLLPASAYAAEVHDDAPDYYWPLQDGSLESALAGGMTLTDATQGAIFGGDPSQHQVLAAGAPIGAGEMLQAIPAAAGFVYEITTNPTTLPAAIEAWVYDAGNSAVHVYVDATHFFRIQIDATSGMEIMYRDGSSFYWDDSLVGPPYVTVNDQQLHHVVAYRSGSNMVVMVDGSVWKSTPLAVGGVGIASATTFIQALSVNTGSRDTAPAISHVAIYNTAPTEARFKAHNDVGRWAWADEYGGARIARALDDVAWPAGDRDISPGGTVQAPYYPEGRTALSYIRDVETSEHPGIVFFARDGKLTFRDRQWLWTRTPAVTFNDNGTGIEYTASNPRGNDVSTIRNVVTVSYARVGAITTRDQPSIDEYGEQPIDGEHLEAPTMRHAQDASNLGRFRTRTRAQPQTIIPELTSEMVPNPGTQIPAVLGLELGDVVAFQRTPMSIGSAIIKKFLVLGIRHHVTAYQWTVTLYLSPPILAAADAPYLEAGHVTRGKVGAAFGNIVPF